MAVRRRAMERPRGGRSKKVATAVRETLQPQVLWDTTTIVQPAPRDSIRMGKKRFARRAAELERKESHAVGLKPWRDGHADGTDEQLE